MIGKIFPDELIKMIKEIQADCKRYSEECRRDAQEEKGDDEFSNVRKMFNYTNAHMETRFQALFRLNANIMDAINGLGAAIDKLPNREDFEDTRSELENVSEKAEISIRVIQKAQQEVEEQRKRGDEVYG